MTRAEILLHIVNHTTYHRGFVAEMIYRVPAPAPTTDLPVFLRDVPQALNGRRHPSAWVVRWAPLITRGTVLDVACGGGRHAKVFLEQGSGGRRGRPRAAADSRRAFHTGRPRGRQPLAARRRALRRHRGHQLPAPAAACRRSGSRCAEGGVLIYETFMLGNERFGSPSNPEFLLRPGELLEAFRGLARRGLRGGAGRGAETRNDSKTLCCAGGEG